MKKVFLTITILSLLLSISNFSNAIDITPPDGPRPPTRPKPNN